MDPTSPHPARGEQPPRGYPPNRGPAYEGGHAYGGGPSPYFYGGPYGYYPHPPPGYAAPGYPSGGSSSSGYPMQTGRGGESSGRVKSPSSLSPYPRGSSGHRHPSPPSRREGGPKSSPEGPGSADAPRTSPTSTNTNSNNNKLADEMETERLRQAALTDVTPEKVTPIKTAFHFFVLEVRERIREMAEAEVRKTTKQRSSEPLDPYLVNSNMNCRLMKAWEELTDSERGALLTREEADRRRFMEEEEIASRHCATLTARSKSPKTPERRSSDRSTLNPSPSNAGVLGPSPSPISRLHVDPPSDEKKFDDPQHEAPVVPPRKIYGDVSPPQIVEEAKDETPRQPKRGVTISGGNDAKRSVLEEAEADYDKEEKTDDPHPAPARDEAKVKAVKEADAKPDAKSSKNDKEEEEEGEAKEGAVKRSSPEKGGSPPKRNRVDDEDPVSDS